jgi:hypothetical protein
MIDEFPSPRRTITQGPLGIESLSLVSPEDFATRTSHTTSRASSSKSHSRLGKKRSKRPPRSPSKSRNKDNQAQVYLDSVRDMRGKNTWLVVVAGKI